MAALGAASLVCVTLIGRAVSNHSAHRVFNDSTLRRALQVRPQQAEARVSMLGKFDRGAGTASCVVADDGIVCASMTGLLIPANAGELSALLLKAGADWSAAGVVATVQKALIALPVIDPRHYSYVPPELRGVPVAVVVTPEQMAVYTGIAEAAALSGTIRRAFLCQEEAQRWVREQARALTANRVWWSVHR